MVVEFVKARKRGFPHIDGYLYYYVREASGKTYWKCRNRSKCLARAIVSTYDGNIIIYQGPVNTQYHDASKHESHAPDFEEVASLKVLHNIKRASIFATTADLNRLFRCNMWFADRTFSSAPIIFTQFFVIMGSVSQTNNDFALPFVYCLLDNKFESSYNKIFEVIISRSREFGIQINLPNIVMTDFELGLINAVKKVIGQDRIKECFFHLCQSVYRHIQSEGLQTKYNDPDDRSLKTHSHMLTALAFVPLDDLVIYFEALQEELPEELLPIANYLELGYIRGRAARGRRRALPPRYEPPMWSQYQSVLDHTARTNNLSEGWHNRIQVIMGRKHQSLYTFLTELQKEHRDTKTMLEQIDLGQRVKPPINPKRKRNEERIHNIVSRYEEYVETDDILTYLRNIAYCIKM